MAKKTPPVLLAPKIVRAPLAQGPFYVIRAAGEDSAEVLIYGDIGESWFGESVTAKKLVEDMQALKDKNLIGRINSYGGSVADGIAIYNAFVRHPKDVTMINDGVAVSAPCRPGISTLMRKVAVGVIDGVAEGSGVTVAGSKVGGGSSVFVTVRRIVAVGEVVG